MKSLSGQPSKNMFSTTCKRRHKQAKMHEQIRFLNDPHKVETQKEGKK
jgi:hypothetical protein